MIFLFSAVVGDPETVIGHRGERVDIRCRYEAGYESDSKYFCKGACIFGFRKIMVKSGSSAEDERFSLTDDTTARVFTVSITDLRTEDTGRYWCAVERPLTDVYSEIMLIVKVNLTIISGDCNVMHCINMNANNTVTNFILLCT
uniref:Immunoglobulin domain-containing protein n=1 Tax=Sinocyclocheilus rhinocerous TaxID=307959 RepID=A0A673FRZ2_9TELE